MKYEYVYSITANVSVEQIKETNGFSEEILDSGIYLINSDILNEYFYYGVYDKHDSLCPTYDANIMISTKSNSYDINYKILSNKHDMVDEVCKLYTKDCFNLNQIIETCGCELDEIYDELGLEIFKIKNIRVAVELLKINEYFDNDYNILSAINKYTLIKKKELY